MLFYFFSHAKPSGGQEEEKRHSHNFLEGENLEEQKSIGGGSTSAPHSSIMSSEITYRHNTQRLLKRPGLSTSGVAVFMGAERREERLVRRFHFSPYKVSWLLSTCCKRLWTSDWGDREETTPA